MNKTMLDNLIGYYTMQSQNDELDEEQRNIFKLTLEALEDLQLALECLEIVLCFVGLVVVIVTVICYVIQAIK